MKKINLLFLLTLGICVISSYSVQAETSTDILPEVREKFGQIIKEMCHNSVNYSLDMEFEAAQEDYHAAQNCLFDQSVVKATNELNKDFKPIFRQFKVDFSAEPIAIKAEDCIAGKIFSTQQKTPTENGYKTMCMGVNDDSTIDKAFSPCKVSEAAWNEFCGYQEYISWKMLDSSLEKEFFEEQESLSTGIEWGVYKNNEQAKMKKELRDIKKTLEESLRQYEYFEQGYRNHLWMSLIYEVLDITRKKTEDLRTAIYMFPAKFHNAASTNCDQ